MKFDLNAVADEHRKRTARLIEACEKHLPPGTLLPADLNILPDALAAVMLELATIWREEAAAVMAANKRGCKGTADALRDAATRLAGVAVAIQKHGLPGETAEEPPRTGVMLGGDQPMFPAVQVTPSLIVKGDSDITTQFLESVGNGKAMELYDTTTGTPALAETIEEAAQEIIAQVTERRAAEEINPHQVKVIKAATFKAETTTTNDAPIITKEGTMLNFTVTTADPVPAWALAPALPDVPVMGLGDDPATWLPVPDHASVSQVQLMGDCAMRYWLRYRRGAPERPSWATVGGSALHTCIETIEMSDMDWTNDIPQLWRARFAAAISETQTANPLFPVETWHASNRGKEDRAWWDADGPEMVHRYLEWRAKWVAEGWELIRTQEGPLVEREFLTFLGGVPVKGFIDQAWYHPQRQIVAIIDAKSGASAQTDYFQPAVYAATLMRGLVASIPSEIRAWTGAYWDARKGELGPLVNLAERHPLAELEYRFMAWRATNQTSVYMPNTNSAYGGCNSCSLKRSCPVGSRIGKGEGVS
jgi:hypothetical protein